MGWITLHCTKLHYTALFQVFLGPQSPEIGEPASPVSNSDYPLKVSLSSIVHSLCSL